MYTYIYRERYRERERHMNNCRINELAKLRAGSCGTLGDSFIRRSCIW